MTTRIDLGYVSKDNEQWSETALGTNSGATAEHTEVATRQHVVTHISGHTDADATLQLKEISADNNTTNVLAEWKKDASIEGWQFAPINGVWIATAGYSVAVVISASTSDCQVNMTGFTL